MGSSKNNTRPFAPLKGVTFVPPPELVLEEVSSTYRAPATELSARAKLSPVRQVRPTFIVQRRGVPPGSKLNDLVAATKAQLLKTLPNIGPIAESPFVFTDGTKGTLVQYSVAALKDLNLMHLLALRLDRAILSTLTIASAEELFSKEVRATYELSLASASVDDSESNDASQE